MLNNKNALVILWTGNDLPDYLTEKIGELLIVNGISKPENLKIIYKDQEGIAKAMLRESNGVTTVKFDIEDNTAEVVKQAVIYIGKRFEGSLASNNTTNFAIALSTAVSRARSVSDFTPLGVNEQDAALLNAVEIIAMKQSIVPRSLAREYHITQSVVNIITQIHNQFA